MKTRNYLFLALFLFCNILTGYSQCSVETNNDTAITCGSPVQLDIVSSSPPDVISWSPAAGLSATNIPNPIASPATTTKYYVTTTTGVCTATDSVTITINPLTANAGTGKSLICGGSVQLDHVTSNYTGNGVMTYSWSSAASLNDATIANPIATINQTTKYYVTVSTPNGCTAMDSVTVNVNPLTADAGADKNFICGGSVQLDNVSSNYTGSGVLTYSWSPTGGLNASNVANPIVSIIKKTTKYYVTITTPNGCMAEDSVTVVVDPLKVNAGNDKNLICGNTVQLDTIASNYTGAGNLTYAWFPVTGLSSTTSISPNSTVKQTTSYSVTITTADGCTAADTVIVNVGPLKVDAGTNKMISCGSLVPINTTTNYTGSGPLTYTWTPSTGLNLSYVPNPDASPGQTTNYFVNIVTPNGCTAMDSVTVNVAPLQVDAGVDDTIICGGESQLKVISNYTGTDLPNYSWTPSAGLNLSNISNPIASITKNTTFIVTVTSVNGCKAIDSIHVFVDALKANVGADRTLICGATNQLLANSNYTGTEPLNYLWTPGAGLNLSNVANPIVSVTKNTTFVVNITTDNGCSANDTINIIVNPLTINAGSDKSHICGKRIQLDSILTNYTGTDALTYTWLPKSGLNNSGIPNPTTNEGGLTYTVTVSTPFGACKATDQVKVDIVPMNGVDICMVTLDSATSKNVIVWNKPEEFGIDSFLIYKETSIAGNFVKAGSVEGNAAGIFKDLTSQPSIKSDRYKISIKDSCGLETVISAAHKTMHLAMSKGTGTTWNLSWEGYEGFPVTSYFIYRGTSKTDLILLSSVSGSANQYADNSAPSGDVYYQLEVIRPSPCNPAQMYNASRSNIVTNSLIGIHENAMEVFAFSIYPNPTSDILNLMIEKLTVKNITLNIYNSLGALVKTTTIEQNHEQLNVSDLATGFYTVELRSANGRAKQKLVIQR
jgi:hypothetical protein